MAHPVSHRPGKPKAVLGVLPVSNVLIPFGLKDDRMVSVDAVATGLACGCICPACFGRLVAKKGASRVHHFAHVASNAICTYGAETAIHRMAKQLLLDARRIFAPGFAWQESVSDDDGVEFYESAIVCEAENHRFDSMFIEADFRGIRPDAIGWLDDRPLLIEIAVRHPVGQDKAERLSRLNVACVEVDLSKVDSSTITEEQLRRLVLDESKTKRWISHPRLGDARERVRSRLRIPRESAADSSACRAGVPRQAGPRVTGRCYSRSVSDVRQRALAVLAAAADFCLRIDSPLSVSR